MSKTQYLITALCSSALIFIVGCQFPETKPTQTNTGLGVVSLPTPYVDQHESYTQIVRHTFSDVGQDFDPCITSDGSQLLYASTRISPRSDIFIKGVDSRVIEQVTSTPNANEKQPSLSPDGQRIIFASDKEGKWNIYEVSAHTRGSRELEVVRNNRINEQPSYSPDGKSIVYVTWDPRKMDWIIATMDLESGQEKLFGPGIFPKFSPDGHKILFQRARVRVPQWYSIWVLDTRTERVSELLSHNNWASVTPNWSPDGKKIIFAAIDKSIYANGVLLGDDIYTIWANGTHLVRLTDDKAPDWHPVWAKNGRIYFISQRNGFQNIWSIKPKDMDPYHPDTIEKKASANRLNNL